MTTSVPLVVGKYALLSQGSSTYNTLTGQVVIVVEHKVSTGSTSGNLTTVAVVQDMGVANAIAAQMLMLLERRTLLLRCCARPPLSSSQICPIGLGCHDGRG